MFQETISNLKKTIPYVIACYAFALLLFQITFYKDGLLTNLLIVTNLTLFFVGPAYFLFVMHSPRMNLDYFLAFFVAYYSAALLSSYYIAIAGVNVKYHTFLIPILTVTASLVYQRFKSNKKQRKH